MEQVLVEHGYEYTARDGRQVSIKPNETFILVSKTSDHWWHVRRDYNSKPFYIPAEYVRKLPSITQHAPDHGHNSHTRLDLLPDRVMCDMSPAQSEVVLTRDKASSADNVKDVIRFSTFGYSGSTQDVKSHKPIKSVIELQTSTESRDLSFHWKRHSPLSGLFVSSELPGGLCDLPHHTPQPPILGKPIKGVSLSHSVIVSDQSELLESLPGREKTFGDVPQSCNISEAVSVMQMPTEDVPGTNCPTSQASTDLSALQVKETTGLAYTSDSASKGQVRA